MLKAHAIRPMQQFSYTPGKNASDMAMTVDGMDLLHEGRVEAFGLVSSDADFTPLAMRLVSGGMQVYGFGRFDTPDAFVNACTTFTPVDARVQPTNGQSATALSDRNKFRGDTRLVFQLRSAMLEASDTSGWAPFESVRSRIDRQAWFEPKNYGDRGLLAVVKMTELFKVATRNGAVMVRDKRTA
jgi:hypothetical protein